MKKLSFLASFILIAVFALSTLFCSAQDSIQYQLVIRNAAGKLITNKQVNMKFSLTGGGQSFYEETQKTTTDKYGNISVFIGTGTAVKGAMKDVPWSTMDISLKVESDTEGGNNFKELGTVPIAAAPYAMFAATAGSNATNGSPKDDEALFEVCDRDGQPVFAVYNSGIVVYVDESAPKAKRSGLVVTGRSSKDGESADYFAVDAEGTHIYVDDTETNKAARSGLIVTGRSASKSATTDEKHISDDRTATKADGVDMFAVSGGLTTVYVDDTDNGDKTPRSGFVVTGRTASKDDKKAIEITGVRTDIKTGTLSISNTNTDATASTEITEAPVAALQLSDKGIDLGKDALVAGGVRHVLDLYQGGEYNVYVTDNVDADPDGYDYVANYSNFYFSMYSLVGWDEDDFCSKYPRLASLRDESLCVPLATKESWLLLNAKKEETAIAEDAVVAVFINYRGSYYYINVWPLRQFDDFDVSFAMTNYNQTSFINGYASEFARFNITLNSSKPYAGCKIKMDGSPDPYKVKITTMNQTTEYEAGLYPNYYYQGEPAVFGEKATFEITELPEGRVLDYWLVNGRRYTGDILKMTVNAEEMHVSAVFKDLSTVVCVDGDYEGEDSNGTEGKPFKTIDDALAAIKTINDNRIDYRINVKNTEAAPIVIGNEYNGCANLIIINLDSEMVDDYSYDPEPNITQLTVATSVPILVKGGMLIPEDNSNLTYAVKVADSKADKKARLVLENCTFGNDDGSFNMNAALVESGELVLNGTSIYSFSANKGGGAIVASGATLTLKGGAYIYGCEAEEKGGCVYLNAGATLNAESCYVYGEVNSDNEAGAAVYAAGAVNFNVNNNARISGVGLAKGAYITAVGEFSDTRYYSEGSVYYYPKVTFDYFESTNDVAVVTDKGVTEIQREIIMANFGISSEYLISLGYSRQLGLDGRPYKLRSVYSTGEFALDFGGRNKTTVNYAYYRNESNDEQLYLKYKWNGGSYYEYRNYYLVDGNIYRDSIYCRISGNDDADEIHKFTSSTLLNGWQSSEWNNYKIVRASDAYNLFDVPETNLSNSTNNGVTHYFVEDGGEDYFQSEWGIVTAINNVDVFKNINNFAALKSLIWPAVSIQGEGLTIDDLQNITWTSGYTLSGYNIRSNNILAGEISINEYSEQPSYVPEAFANKASPDFCRFDTYDIDDWFDNLRNGFDVNVYVSYTGGGKVQISTDGVNFNDFGSNNRKFAFQDQITLKAVADEGYEFFEWSDGNANAERQIIVTDEISIYAKFTRIFTVTNADEFNNSISQLTSSNNIIYIDGVIKGNFDIPENKTVTIRGKTGKDNDVLDGDNVPDGDVLYVRHYAEVTIENLKITGGSSYGISGQSYSEITLNNVLIENNRTGEFSYGNTYINSGTEIKDNSENVYMHPQGGRYYVRGGYVESINYEYSLYTYGSQFNPHPEIYVGGDAQIGPIYLKNTGYYHEALNTTPGIFIESPLTNYSNDNPIVVNIKNPTYSGEDVISDQPLIKKAQSSSPIDISVESQKFVLTNDDYYIDEDGYIRKNTNITVNSESEQTVIGDAVKSAAKKVIANFESDFTLKPLSSYLNSAGFEGDGRDAVVEVPAGKTLVLTAESSVTLDFPCLCGYFFDVSGTLIIGQNITISGINGIHWNAIRVQSGGNVILDGGTIKNSNGGGAGRGAVIIEDGTFVMESGLITDSEGGVFVEGGTFIMNGGEISGNRFSSQEAGGGGVTVTSGAKFIKQPEGAVKNNTYEGGLELGASQMYIFAGGQYGLSEDDLRTFEEDTKFDDAF